MQPSHPWVISIF